MPLPITATTVSQSLWLLALLSPISTSALSWLTLSPQSSPCPFKNVAQKLGGHPQVPNFCVIISHADYPKCDARWFPMSDKVKDAGVYCDDGQNSGTYVKTAGPSCVPVINTKTRKEYFSCI